MCYFLNSDNPLINVVKIAFLSVKLFFQKMPREPIAAYLEESDSSLDAVRLL
jgi:hypothetical protein